MKKEPEFNLNNLMRVANDLAFEYDYTEKNWVANFEAGEDCVGLVKVYQSPDQQVMKFDIETKLPHVVSLLLVEISLLFRESREKIMRVFSVMPTGILENDIQKITKVLAHSTKDLGLFRSQFPEKSEGMWVFVTDGVWEKKAKFIKTARYKKMEM